MIRDQAVSGLCLDMMMVLPAERARMSEIAVLDYCCMSVVVYCCALCGVSSVLVYFCLSPLLTHF